jgi:hypothetical protein
MKPERRDRIDAVMGARVDPDQYPYLYGWLESALAANGVVTLEDFEVALLRAAARSAATL